MGDVRRLSHDDDRPPERTVLLSWLVASGRAVDIVLAVIAVELVWLTMRGGWTIGDAALRLAPGALMLVALRAALTQQDWRWIALPLLLSFPVHLADLARTPRRGPRPGG